MRTTSIAKAICVFSLMALSVPALARWDHVSREPAVTQPGRLEFAWDGGKHLGIGLPATVHYSEQGAPRVVVTGSDEMLRRVRFGDGDIYMDDDGFYWNRDRERLDVTVTGVPLSEFSVSGSGKLILGKLKRDQLAINVSGSGAVELEASVSSDADMKVSGSGHINFGSLETKTLKARISGSGGIDGKGHAETLDLDMSGSGRFADIAATRADVTMSGSGRATIAAQQQARVRIAGSATVHMPVKPPQLDVSVSGSGHVVTD